MTFVTIVPQPWNKCDIRLWNKCDNSLGTTVTSGFGTSVTIVMEQL